MAAILNSDQYLDTKMDLAGGGGVGTRFPVGCKTLQQHFDLLLDEEFQRGGRRERHGRVHSLAVQRQQHVACDSSKQRNLADVIFSWFFFCDCFVYCKFKSLHVWLCSVAFVYGPTTLLLYVCLGSFLRSVSFWECLCAVGFGL